MLNIDTQESIKIIDKITNWDFKAVPILSLTENECKLVKDILTIYTGQKLLNEFQMEAMKSE